MRALLNRYFLARVGQPLRGRFAVNSGQRSELLPRSADARSGRHDAQPADKYRTFEERISLYRK